MARAIAQAFAEGSLDADTLLPPGQHACHHESLLGYQHRDSMRFVTVRPTGSGEMAIWNDKWFAGEGMPPNNFPHHLIEPAQAIAEAWLFDASFRCILTEWVSASQADEEMGGLLWSGFRLRGQPDKRVAPKPILVRLLFTEPFPADTTELRLRMREHFGRAVREWIQGRQQYGDAFGVAP